MAARYALEDTPGKLEAIPTEFLVDEEAHFHETQCDQMPSHCFCPEVKWIWASRPNRPHGIRGGKWMIFSNTMQIDSTWNKVKDLLASGKLGIFLFLILFISAIFNESLLSLFCLGTLAKVAPVSLKRDGGHLICVYTTDHQDVRDVFRVLVVLLRNRLANYRIINYKTDDATLSGVYSSDSAAVLSGRFDRSFKPNNKNYLVSKYSALKVNDTGSEIDLLKSIKMYLNNIGPQVCQTLLYKFT